MQWTQEGKGDWQQAAKPRGMMEQIRSSGGEVLEAYERMEMFYEGQAAGMARYMKGKEERKKKQKEEEDLRAAGLS
jgi:hypothetical protein